MVDSTVTFRASLGWIQGLDDGRVHPLGIVGLQDSEFGRPELFVVASLTEHIVAVWKKYWIVKIKVNYYLGLQFFVSINLNGPNETICMCYMEYKFWYKTNHTWKITMQIMFSKPLQLLKYM